MCTGSSPGASSFSAVWTFRTRPACSATRTLLGAAALGDIGHLFPDNDPAYAGADSLALLHEVTARLHAAGYTVGNLDCTVLAQAPKLAPHIALMRRNLAQCMGVEVDRVSVKATTEEGLGFTGAREGIAAHAVVLIERVS
mgnify:CR=1 FL=1